METIGLFVKIFELIVIQAYKSKTGKLLLALILTIHFVVVFYFGFVAWLVIVISCSLICLFLLTTTDNEKTS